ncbi:MAG: hypothetical protein MJZ11_09895 [Lachnospiraceae bacterium]|nr:hypothetical protein [Lachnospiraceae bacterium]
MKNKMIKISTKISTALVVAASVMTMASITAFAADDTVIADETVAIEEMAATEEAPECEMTVPETEGQGDIIDDEFAYVEGQGDVIDDEFAYVEGQGDVIDDEFAYVEGQGDVIDDEFAYVEGQGDVIDDQFAVTPEAEAAVEAVEVAENDTEVVAPSVNSFVGVGSAEASQNNSEEKTDNKSDITKGLEITNDILNPLNNVYGKPICKEIDNCDVLGKDEKEMAKLFVKTGLGVADGVVLGDFIPGFGAMRKGTKMAENFSKALDAKTTTEEIAYTIEGVKNFGEAVVSAVPGGGLVVAAANVKQAIQGYCVKKVVDFVKWLF